MKFQWEFPSIYYFNMGVFNPTNLQGAFLSPGLSHSLLSFSILVPKGCKVNVQFLVKLEQKLAPVLSNTARVRYTSQFQSHDNSLPTATPIFIGATGYKHISLVLILMPYILCICSAFVQECIQTLEHPK